MPPEIQRLGRVIKNWFDTICDHHLARTTEVPAELFSNLIERVRRIGFSYRSNRVRASFDADEPNWWMSGVVVIA
ncbi:MAG: hypothetical protein ACYCPK_03425 [Acidimicrobiales bacterium]